MKIHTNFVSNSSSSSFVLLVDEEEHERVIATLHPYVAAVVEHVMGSDKVFGKKVRSHGELVVNGESYFWENVMWDFKYDGEVPDDVDDPSEAFDVYQKAVDKTKTFSYSTDG